jgi:hypothetical protein
LNVDIVAMNADLGALSSGWSKAQTAISNGWENLKNSFLWEGASKAWDGLVSAAGAAWENIKSGWNGVSNLIDSGLSKAGQMLSGAWSWMKDLVGIGDNPVAVEQATLAAQLGDITMLNKMSEGFSARVAEMTEAWQPFKNTLGQGFGDIYGLMGILGDKINSTVIPAVLALSLALNGVASGVQAIAAAGEMRISSPVSVPSYVSADQIPPGGIHALGGIFDTPHIGMVAEAGTEAIIPLTDRSRGIPLWMAAGEEMGMRFGGNSTTTANNTAGPAPIVNITVNGGDPDIGRQVADEVRRVLREFQEYNDRVQLP